MYAGMFTLTALNIEEHTVYVPDQERLMVRVIQGSSELIYPHCCPS